MKAKLCVLWAINPLDIDSSSIAEVERLLDAAASAVVVHPVYVLSAYELGVDVELFNDSLSSFKKGINLKLKVLFSRLKNHTQNFKRVKIITHKKTSVEESVDKLLDYAKKIKADFILVGVSGKKEKQKKSFGTFSKILLSKSEKASIAIGLKKGSSSRPHTKILFATDLSHSSILDLIKFSFLSKKLGSRLTFVKKGHFESEKEAVRRLSQFSKLAKKCGVQATYVQLGKDNPSADDLASYASTHMYSLMGLSCSVLNSV